MPSVSSAHLVLFIAAVLVSAVLAGTITQGATQIGNAIEEDSEAKSEHTDAAISIVSDAQSPNAVYNNTTDTLTLYVKNVGAGSLPRAPDEVTLLVNGTYQSDTRTTVLGSDEDWREGSVLRIRANVTLPASAATRVSVSVTGAQDYFTFTTP